MSNKSSKAKKSADQLQQPTLSDMLFPDLGPTEAREEEPEEPEVLKLRLKERNLTSALRKEQEIVQAIPKLVLPTRWENLQPKIETNRVSLGTIIRPIPQAMSVVRSIIEYLRTTGGCQVLIIRADTGSGKTTFLNTLPHYMQEVSFHLQTIELQSLDETGFRDVLWNIATQPDKINLIILEGREKPATVADTYVQSVLADINRFSRSRRVPMLFVIPTIEEAVARNWCDHASRIGDLIPEGKLYEGSRWYNFPGVSKSEYLDIVEETVRTLNPPYALYDYGVSPSSVKDWVDAAPTIGKFIETVAGKISTIKGATTTVVRGKRIHVWVVYCCPDLRHYDHTYLIMRGLCQDDDMRVAPTKLFAPGTDADLAKHWRKEPEWAKLVTAINFLDVRLINFPITSVVTAALAYGTNKLINTFKEAQLDEYKDRLQRAMGNSDANWNEALADRRLQAQVARESLARTNLFRLLRNMQAEPLKGGNTEQVKGVAQYWHLLDKAQPRHLHYYVGRVLQDVLEYHQFPGYIGVETETPVVEGQSHPVPDIAIHTESEIYALEFHFLGKQAAPSEIARYAVKNVIEKYMRGLPYLSSQLQAIYPE